MKVPALLPLRGPQIPPANVGQPAHCPQCLTPATDHLSRLVREICGHWKCRQCLLREDSGCRTCQKFRGEPAKFEFRGSTPGLYDNEVQSNETPGPPRWTHASSNLGPATGSARCGMVSSMPNSQSMNGYHWNAPEPNEPPELIEIKRNPEYLNFNGNQNEPRSFQQRLQSTNPSLNMAQEIPNEPTMAMQYVGLASPPMDNQPSYANINLNTEDQNFPENVINKMTDDISLSGSFVSIPLSNDGSRTKDIRNDTSSSQDSSQSKWVEQGLCIPATFQKSIRHWINNNDFGNMDEDLTWLRCEYYSHVYDSLVNKDVNENIIERGKAIALEIQYQVREALSRFDQEPKNEEENRESKNEVEKLKSFVPDSSKDCLADNIMQEVPSKSHNVQSEPQASKSQIKTRKQEEDNYLPNSEEVKLKRKRKNLLSPENYQHVVTSKNGYLCTICHREFKNRLNIRYHIVCADKSAGHPCPKCDRIFKSSSHLTYHDRTQHGGVKPYECKVCLKSFAQSSKLKRHMLIHSGEKPYECKICKRGFTTKYNLQEHENIHKGEKPYSCDSCNASFNDKNNLRRHRMASHNREGNPKPTKGFQCRLCTNHTFYETRATLLKHVKTFHGDKLELFQTSVGNQSHNPAMESSYENKAKINQPKIVSKQQDMQQLSSLQLDLNQKLNTCHNDHRKIQSTSSHSPSSTSLSSRENFLKIKTLLRNLKGKEIYQLIESLSSTERRLLIRIMSKESSSKNSTSTRTTKSEWTCSDVSTPSKKEFLRRYKRQILEDSETSASLESTPEKRILFDEFTKDDFEFPTPILSGEQMTSLDVVLKGMQSIAANIQSNEDNKPDMLVKSTGLGLRKVSIFEEDLC